MLIFTARKLSHRGEGFKRFKSMLMSFFERPFFKTYIHCLREPATLQSQKKKVLFIQEGVLIKKIHYEMEDKPRNIIEKNGIQDSMFFIYRMHISAFDT